MRVKQIVISCTVISFYFTQFTVRGSEIRNQAHPQVNGTILNGWSDRQSSVTGDGATQGSCSGADSRQGLERGDRAEGAGAGAGRRNGPAGSRTEERAGPEQDG